MALAGLFQTNGWQCWFQAVLKRLIAVMRSLTLAKSPRRSAWRSMIEKKTSTRLSHDAEVGVKCSWTRGCLAQPCTNSGVLVGGVVVADDMELAA
jgi:hypothetical protein